MNDPQPFSDNYQAYWDAGWKGLFPLPAGEKAPPPDGVTGHAGENLSFADLYELALDRCGQNIAIRVRRDGVGIDVDDYNGKGGGATLLDLEDQLGELPPTVISSARLGQPGENGVLSGIRHFRVPYGTRFIDRLTGIEICQASHRYVVAPPSIHDKLGTEYEWLDQRTGEVSTTPPNFDDLPMLPQAWIDYLSKSDQSAPASGAPLGDGDVKRQLQALPGGDPCPCITRAVASFGDGSRHDSMRDKQRQIVALAKGGCPGGIEGLRQLKAKFIDSVAGDKDRKDDPEAEWDRSLIGAFRLAADIVELGCDDDITRFVVGPEGQASQESQAGQESQETGDGDDSGEEKPDEDVLDEKYGFLDWHKLWDEPDEFEWCIPHLVPRGATASIIAKQGLGKSLLTLEAAAAIATGGEFLGEKVEKAHVLYIDYEQDRSTVRDRLESLGYGPDDLEYLHYSLLGDWPALDTPEGGKAILGMCQKTGSKVVIADTLSRAVIGEENSADTYNKMQIYTVKLLKQNKVTFVRLDHSGKDSALGARGSSAKSSDVDLEYVMADLGAGKIQIRRTKNRTNLEGDQIIVARDHSPLRHRIVGEGAMSAAEAKTIDCVIKLDDLDAPLDISRRAARVLLAAAHPGMKISNQYLSGAIKRRQVREGES